MYLHECSGHIKIGEFIEHIVKPFCDSLVIAINAEVLGCFVDYALKKNL